MTVRHRLQTGDASFQQASFVADAGFVAVQIAQMDFHPGDCSLNRRAALRTGASICWVSFPVRSIAVGVDLNLHESFSGHYDSKPVDRGDSRPCRHLPGRNNHDFAPHLEDTFAKIVEQVINVRIGKIIERDRARRGIDGA